MKHSKRIFLIGVINFLFLLKNIGIGLFLYYFFGFEVTVIILLADISHEVNVPFPMEEYL